MIKLLYTSIICELCPSNQVSFTQKHTSLMQSCLLNTFVPICAPSAHCLSSRSAATRLQAQVRVAIHLVSIFQQPPSKLLVHYSHLHYSSPTFTPILPFPSTPVAAQTLKLRAESDSGPPYRTSHDKVTRLLF